MSCVDDGNCTAVGTDTATHQPLYSSEVGGVRDTPQEDTTAPGGGGHFSGPSCVPGGSCTAGGVDRNAQPIHAVSQGTPCSAGSCESEPGALLTDVTGAGPGRSLADEATSLEALCLRERCVRRLQRPRGVVQEVNARAGKKIASAQAASLIGRAEWIEAVLGCSAG